MFKEKGKRKKAKVLEVFDRPGNRVF